MKYRLRGFVQAWTLLALICSVVYGHAAVAEGVRERAGGLLEQASAAVPHVNNGQRLYDEYCAHCHKARGAATGPRQYPQIGGQREDYLLAQLVHFIALDRFSPTMHRVLLEPTLSGPQSLRDLTAYLAGQSRELHGEHGDPMGIRHGQHIYLERCAGCHGNLGVGQAQGPIPAIGGQNYTYLLIQLRGFAAGHRGAVDPSVTDAVTKLSSTEMAAVADYTSRLPDSASYLRAP